MSNVEKALYFYQMGSIIEGNSRMTSHMGRGYSEG
jgi:hypothetical protein